MIVISNEPGIMTVQWWKWISCWCNEPLQIQSDCCTCRDVISSDAVLSSDEELETVSGSMQHDHLTVASGALFSKDKCRKSLKLTSDQLVSHWLFSVLALTVSIKCFRKKTSTKVNHIFSVVRFPHFCDSWRKIWYC